MEKKIEAFIIEDANIRQTDFFRAKKDYSLEGDMIFLERMEYHFISGLAMLLNLLTPVSPQPTSRQNKDTPARAAEYPRQSPLQHVQLW